MNTAKYYRSKTAILLLAGIFLFGGCHAVKQQEISETTPSIQGTELTGGSETTALPAQSQKVDDQYHFTKDIVHHDTVQTYGNDERDFTKQGVDHWYYMYTEETDQDGVYDISKIKECRYSEDEKVWTANIGGENMRIWAQDSLTSVGMHPEETEDGNPYASAVFAFQAPEDGSYFCEIHFTAGSEDPITEDRDGVTFSVYNNTEKLYSRRFLTLSEGDFIEVKLMLKAGEYCYLIADPNENSNGDIFNDLRMHFTHTCSTYIDNVSAWGFGKSYANGDGTQQGMNNWYYMYTEETNRYGNYNTDAIKECRYQNDLGTWLPDIYNQNDKNFGNSHGEIWQQDVDGHIWPSVHNDPYASAVLAFCAPADGIYTFDVAFAASTSTGQCDCKNIVGDGMTVSFYEGNRKIYSETMRDYLYPHYTMQAELKKEECFYLIVDPNENGLGDEIWELNVVAQKTNG